MNDNITHLRKGKLIQDVSTLEITDYKTINAAKRHSRAQHHDARTLKVVDKLMPTSTE